MTYLNLNKSPFWIKTNIRRIGKGWYTFPCKWIIWREKIYFTSISKRDNRKSNLKLIRNYISNWASSNIYSFSHVGPINRGISIFLSQFKKYLADKSCSRLKTIEKLEMYLLPCKLIDSTSDYIYEFFKKVFDWLNQKFPKFPLTVKHCYNWKI